MSTRKTVTIHNDLAEKLKTLAKFWDLNQSETMRRIFELGYTLATALSEGHDIYVKVGKDAVLEKWIFPGAYYPIAKKG